MHKTNKTIFALILVLLFFYAPFTMAQDDPVSPFMTVGTKTTQPVGHHEFCALHSAECAVRSEGRQRVKLTDENWQTLLDVNLAVNTMIAPVTDQDLFGRPEVWTYPDNSGDCEDYVLLKRRMLIERGWPTGALLITVVRQESGEGHAVLTVLTDRGDLVLDNLESRVSLWTGTPYRYLKRQSSRDTGAWVSIDDGRASMVGSLQR